MVTKTETFRGWADRRRATYRIIGVLALTASCTLAVGCGGYPRVGMSCFELAQALYTVCNLENDSQLTTLQEIADSRRDSGEITDVEHGLLTSIIETASDGEWDRAEQQARRLLEDQNED